MVDPFDDLFARYDAGRIGRRELLGALAALIAAGRSPQPPQNQRLEKCSS